ncbi:MAG: hypothetical protein CVV27_10810 [Candidatus Melainabacteria bacterium HGW-Melainabacteria-1]|nr:MAG: hypothetical protein CVV27_10810 [Candidatus Melainabacteria bacterium HGW-Melainabacteria-1]
MKAPKPLFAVGLTLFLLGCAADQRRYNPDWPMFQRDAGHSGAVEDAPRPPLKQKWAFATEGRLITPPSVLGGIVYFGSRDSRVYALGLEDGAKRFDIELEQGGIHSALTLTESLIFAGKAEPYYFLYAWNRANGETLWSRQSGELINRPPWTLTDGLRLYTHLDPRLDAAEGIQVRIAGLDPATGESLWETPLPGIPQVVPALATELLLVASNDQRLRALDVASGELRWEVELVGKPVSAPLISQGRALLATEDGFIYAFELTSGKVAWRYQFPETRLQGDLALSGQLLLVPAGRQLLSFDLADLEPRWRFRAPAEVTAPVASREHVYLGCANGMFYVLNINNGSVAGLYRTGGEILAPPVLAGGLALVASSDGKLYAFEEQPAAEQPRTMPRPSSKPSWMDRR